MSCCCGYSHPALKKSDALETAIKKSNVESNDTVFENRSKFVVGIEKDGTAAKDVTERSFCGTETTDPEWSVDFMAGPKLKDRNNADRRMLSRLIAEYALEEACINARDGVIVSAREEGTNEISAVLGLRLFMPKYRKTWGDWWHANFVCFFWRKRIRKIIFHFFINNKACDKDKDECKRIETRLNNFDKCMNEHSKVMPGAHLYVQVLATHPDFQKRGLGTKLMNVCNSIADELGVDSYLECNGEKNVRFYSKFGYEVKKQCEVEGAKGEESYKEFYCMARNKTSS